MGCALCNRFPFTVGFEFVDEHHNGSSRSLQMLYECREQRGSVRIESQVPKDYACSLDIQNTLLPRLYQKFVVYYKNDKRCLPTTTVV